LIKTLFPQKKRTFQDKILTLDQALFFIQQKEPSHTVAFTNGCFDLLHQGHVSYLQEASSLASYLIVGLNTDASVQRLKGPSRPLNHENSRAVVLASLEAIDIVVLFDQDTPLDLITALKPDVLIKGADYTLNQIVGAKEVLAYGGTVKTINFIPGFSTTQTIKKIQS
jgi:rfaE bifunctional protein nucleotidyltransferase chain/domain